MSRMADPKLAAAAHQYSSMVECDGNNMWGSLPSLFSTLFPFSLPKKIENDHVTSLSLGRSRHSGCHTSYLSAEHHE